MIITTIEENILVYCNRLAYILQDKNLANRRIIEHLQKNIGAPVKSVYKEIQCGNMKVLVVEHGELIVAGVHKYSVSLDLFYANYVFPDRILACFENHCWTCISENNLHIMKLELKWYENIVNGKKIIEGRLYDEKRKKIGIGDCIIFKPVGHMTRNTLLYTVVLGLRHYNSFREMLEKEGIERVLPGVYDLNEGVEVYREYYSVEDEKKYGVIAIELGLL